MAKKEQVLNYKVTYEHELNGRVRKSVAIVNLTGNLKIEHDPHLRSIESYLIKSGKQHPQILDWEEIGFVEALKPEKAI